MLKDRYHMDVIKESRNGEEERGLEGGKHREKTE